MARVTVSSSERETEAAGAALAAGLQRGAWVLLYGDLGAGKTVFVRGMAEGLGVEADDVSSPTFTLIQEYRGTLTLYHVDLYRVAEREADDLGLEELGASGGVVVVEWAEKLGRRRPGAIEVRLADLGDDRREISISGGTGLSAYSER